MHKIENNNLHTTFIIFMIILNYRKLCHVTELYKGSKAQK